MNEGAEYPPRFPQGPIEEIPPFEAKQSHCENCDPSFTTCWNDGSLCVKKAREANAEKIIKEDGEKLRALAFEIYRLMDAGSTEKAIEKIDEFRQQNYDDANN